MNSNKLFSMSLCLQYLWKLNDVDFAFEQGEKVLRIDIGFEKGAKFSDPDTGQPCPVHDTMERRWHHLNFFEHTCYIHCKVPRVICSDGTVKQVDVPWARKGSGFTMLFGVYSMMLIKCEMPVNRVGKAMREYPNRIWTIFDHWVGQAYEKVDHSQITQLGVDETSSRKGHSYMTIGVDMDERRVIHATEWKGAATIESIKDYLETKKTPPEQIDQVCIDLSPAFISGVESYFLDAQITFDRFHVKALLNKAMDEVRKRERRRHVELKGHTYTFLKSIKQLTEDQSMQRHILVELYPQLGEAYRLKELFDDFWTMKTPQEARGFLAFWCDMTQESEIAPFLRFVKTVKKHWDGILNYITSKLTNGILEGINSKIQLIKRRARGYRNTTNFINMIYFTCGKLQFDYPHRLT